ncbi:hypothetical protein FKM82_026703 [Ascaphus truei]|uniref:natriuretic peptides A-like n=1 Tax=Ascaphus truei TaxID=8439 RepID=UPI003F5ADDD5
MEFKVYLFCGSLLLVIIQLHSTGAHPILELDTAGDLGNLKDVLERLEEKVALIEALEASPGVLEPRPKGGIQFTSPEDSDVPQQQEQPVSRALPNNPDPFKDSFLKGLRSLPNLKMTRGSGCFGRRIDRINSLSGLGCRTAGGINTR